MAYAQVSDIRAAMPQVEINASTRPSEQTVVAMLARVHGDVNGQLANLGYVTPVTVSDEAVAIVKDVVVQLTCAAVLRARGAGADPTVLQAAADCEKYGRDRLKDLANPNTPAELPGAVRTDSQLAKLPEDKFGSTADDGLYYDSDPRMTRDQRF